MILHYTFDKMFATIPYEGNIEWEMIKRMKEEERKEQIHFPR